MSVHSARGAGQPCFGIHEGCRHLSKEGFQGTVYGCDQHAALLSIIVNNCAVSIVVCCCQLLCSSCTAHATVTHRQTPKAVCLMQGPPRVACPHGIPQPCLHNPLSPIGPQPLHTAPTPSLWQSPHGRTLHPHQSPHGRTPSPWAPPVLLLHQQGLVIPLQGCLRPRLLSPAIRGVPMTCCQIPCLEAYRQASITTASMWTLHNSSIPSCITLVPSNDGNNQK